MAYEPRVDIDTELALLLRNAATEVPPGSLKEKLSLARREKRPLRVKFGMDPSSAEIHLGHTVPMRKLRQFQDAGHTVIFLIGDFTARIGDPTGKSVARPPLTEEQVRENAKTYLDQVGLVLDRDRTEIRYNSEWCAPMTFADVIRLASKYTVARILERNDFSERYKAGKPIAVHEFLYPLVQGYDSVALKADVEMCSTDQIFNCMVARALQEDAGQLPESIVSMPLIEGTDGVAKMSKSMPEHAIGITDPPDEMYGKLLSIPDELVPKYAGLLLDEPMPDGLGARDAKHYLSESITSMYFGDAVAHAARERFEKVFVRHEVPDDAAVVTLPKSLVKDGRAWAVALLMESRLAPSKAEARRLIDQGAVELDGAKVSDSAKDVPVRDGSVLRVGKRRFARLKLSGD